MSSANPQTKSKIKANIIVIGREGRMDSLSTPNYKLAKPQLKKTLSPKGNDLLKTPSKLNIVSIFDDKELNEISRSEIADEVINPDIQYFLTFCALVYLVRSLHIMYLVAHEVFSHQKTNENNQLVWIFIVANLVFGIVLFVTAVTGYFFCWKMRFHCGHRYLISLTLSSALLAARLVLALIYEVNDEAAKNSNLMRKVFKVPDDITEFVFDMILLLLNLIISFFVSKLYEQISETHLTLTYEPDEITVHGKAFERVELGEKEQRRLFYILKKFKKSRRQVPRTPF